MEVFHTESAGPRGMCMHVLLFTHSGYAGAHVHTMGREGTAFRIHFYSLILWFCNMLHLPKSPDLTLIIRTMTTIVLLCCCDMAIIKQGQARCIKRLLWARCLHKCLICIISFNAHDNPQESNSTFQVEKLTRTRLGTCPRSHVSNDRGGLLIKSIWLMSDLRVRGQGGW